VLRAVTIDGMTERWLALLRAPRAPRALRTPRAGRVAGVLLVLAAFGQALGQAVTLGYASGGGSNPALLAFLYAVGLCALALLSTVPLLLMRPLWSAVLTVPATVLALAWFPALTVAGAVAAVYAVWRLGAAGPARGSPRVGDGSPRVAGGSPRVRGGDLAGVAVEYLAVVLAVPFLVLALVRHGDVACVLLAWAVPAAGAAGIALRAGRAARTFSEAGEALADTLVAHTARGTGADRPRAARRGRAPHLDDRGAGRDRAAGDAGAAGGGGAAVR